MRFILTCLILSIFFTGTALAEPFAYIANSHSGNVSVIDVSTNTVIATVDVGGDPFGVAVTPDGEFVYVTSLFSAPRSVSVIQTSTNTVIATVEVGEDSFGVAVTPDGEFVYAAISGQLGAVSVIQTSDNTVIDKISVLDPTGVAVTPNGEFVYVTSDGLNVSVIQTSTNTVIATVEVGEDPFGVAVTPDGKFVYVTNETSNTVSVIQTSDNTVVAMVGGGEGPHGVAVTPDGKFVYVANTVEINDVFVIQTSDNTLADIVEVGDDPVGVAVTPDGEFVYVTIAGKGAVSVIQTSDNTVIATVGVGGDPSGVAVTPMRQDPLADVNIDKASNIPNRIRRGRESTITYFISLESTGEETARDVVVTDMLPEGSVFEPDLSSENCELLVGANTVECIVGDLTPGETAFLDIAISIVCEEDVLNQAVVEFLDGEGETRLKDSNIWTVRCTSSSSSCSITSAGATPSIPLFLLIPVVIIMRRVFRKRLSS